MISGCIKKEVLLLFTLIRHSTNQPHFSSNSIYGILDLLLTNWANDDNFTLIYDAVVETITVNGIDYDLEYHPLAGNPRGEVLIDE